MDAKQAIIDQFRAVYSSLVDVSNVAGEAQLGASDWFCDGYPFGMDLDEFIAELAEYIGRLEESK